jgi:hypothetical protein
MTSSWSSSKARRFRILLAIECSLTVFLLIYAWGFIRTINRVLEETGYGYRDATVEYWVLGIGSVAWMSRSLAPLGAHREKGAHGPWVRDRPIHDGSACYEEIARTAPGLGRRLRGPRGGVIFIESSFWLCRCFHAG